MKKKFTVILALVFTICFVITGCSKEETAQVEEPTQDGEATEQSEEIEGAISKPEDYPSENIEFLIPAPAGAMIDVAMRSLGEMIEFGEPSVIVNVAGASQTIGLTEVFSGGDDPHVITAAGFAGYIIQPNIIDLPYSVDDFRYIAINHPPEPQILISSSDSKYQTWEDVISAIEAGEEVTYSAPNANGLGRMALLEVTSQEDIEVKFVPYSGSAEGFAALLGGHIDFYVIDSSVAVPRIIENQFTGLMIVGADRVSTIPDVPSAHELGLTDMEKFVGFTAIAVNNQVDDEVVNWLKYKIDEAQQSQAYKTYLAEVVGVEEALPLYTEEEVTAMVYEASEAITEVMDKYGLSNNGNN